MKEKKEGKKKRREEQKVFVLPWSGPLNLYEQFTSPKARIKIIHLQDWTMEPLQSCVAVVCHFNEFLPYRG